MRKHKLLILALVVLLGITPLFATDYYVKNGGNDAASGLDDDNAWETISKVNGESFSGDDIIYFNKGDEWREQLTVPDSGTSGHQITIGAYGDGADPIINGSDIITTWTAYGGAATTADYALDEEAAKAYQNIRDMIYATKLSTSGSQIRITLKAHSTDSYTVNSCFIGISDTVGNEYDYSATPTRITFATSNSVTVTGGGSDVESDWITFALDEAVDYVIGLNETGGKQTRNSDGAYLVYANNDGTDDSADMSFSSDEYASRHYYVDEIEVRSALGSTWQNAIGATEPLIVWMDDTELTEGSGSGALADHEWVFDSNVLYLRDDTGDPDGSGVVIEAGQRTQGIKVQDKDYITIDGLDCQKANYWGIYVYQGSSYVNVTNCVLHTNRIHGIRHDTVSFCTVTSTTAYGNGLQGIGFNVASTPGCSASDCTSYSNGEEGYGVEAGSDDFTYTDCVAYQNGKAGFSTSDVTGIVYTRCTSYENGQVVANSGHGFGLWDDESVGSQAYYYYCIAYDNLGSGLRINYALTGGSASRAYNCVFYSNSQYNVQINEDTLDMKNCILMDAGWDKEFKSDAGISPTLANNCYYDSDASTTCEFDESDYTAKAAWETASGETGSVWANPLMTDPASQGFTINPHSPCVDAGADVSLTEDYLGLKIRHAPDIGAYENQANALFHSVLVTLRIIDNKGRLRWP